LLRFRNFAPQGLCFRRFFPCREGPKWAADRVSGVKRDLPLMSRRSALLQHMPIDGSRCAITAPGGPSGSRAWNPVTLLYASGLRTLAVTRSSVRAEEPSAASALKVLTARSHWAATRSATTSQDCVAT
jgi:hypothetical protein